MVAELAKQFVCVRIQSMNGVNLNAFPFEYDLTWMSFFQDSGGKTYARYGGREDADAESHLNQASLVKTMREVLKLHAKQATQEPSRFEPVAADERLPSDIPPMEAMIGKRQESCIHCHDVKVAQLRQLHASGKLKKEMVFTYPSPLQLGIHVDAEQQQLIEAVTPNSAAAAADLRRGDRILASDGQRILTFGDLTRVLELAPEKGTLPLIIERSGDKLDRQVELAEGWRASSDPAWRPSLHVVGPGAGFWGRRANAKEREPLQLNDSDLALKVTFIWAPHAKAAKVQLGDIIVDLDGFRGQNLDMRQFHGFLQMKRHWGDTIRLKAMRNGKSVDLTMKLPDQPPFE